MADNNNTVEYAVKITADTKGVFKGIDDVYAALERAEKRWQEYRKKMSNAGNIGNSMKSQVETLDQMTERYKAMYSEMSKIGSGLSGIGKTLSNSTKDVSSKYSDMSKASNDLADTNKEASKSFQELKKQIDEMSQVSSSSLSELREQFSQLSKISNVDWAVENAKKASDEVDKLEAKIQELSKQSFETKSFKNLNKDIEKADKTLQKYLDRQSEIDYIGTDKASKQYKTLQARIEFAREKQEKLNAERQKMIDEGTAYFSGEDTSKYEKYVSDMEKKTLNFAKAVKKLRDETKANIELMEQDSNENKPNAEEDVEEYAKDFQKEYTKISKNFERSIKMFKIDADTSVFTNISDEERKYVDSSKKAIKTVTDEINEDFENTVDKSKDLYRELSKIRSAMINIALNENVTNDFKGLDNAIKETSKAVSKYEKLLADGKNIGVENGMPELFSDVSKQAEDARKILDNLERTKEASLNYDDYSKQQEKIENQIYEIDKMRNSLDSAMQSITKSLNDAKSASSDIVHNLSERIDTSEFEEIPDCIEEATEKTNFLKETLKMLTIPTLRSHIGAYSDEADELRQKISDVKEEMSDLAQQEFHTDEYDKTAAEIGKTESKLNDYIAKLKEAYATGKVYSPDAWKKEVYNISETIKYYNSLISKKKEYEDTGNAKYKGVDTEEYESLSGYLDELESQLYDVENSGERVATSVLRSFELNFGGKLKSVIGGGVKTAASLAKSGLTNMGNAAKRASKHFRLLSKETTSLDAIMKRAHKTFLSLKRMLMGRLKRTFIGEIVNNASENIGQIARISERFNSAITGLVVSWKLFRAQLIAAVEPIASIVIPYLNMLLDKMTECTDTIAQFIARATGNQTYIKATKGNYDYAKSLDSTTDKTKNATKATKEYQNTVLGFDQLNKLNGVNGTDDTDTTNATAVEKAQTQATALNRIADEIHKALSEKRFKDAGKAVGKAINEAFSWAKNVAGWEKNSKKITKVLRNLIDFVNGISDGFNGVTVGEAIGDVVNTVIESLKLLTDPTNGIDFYSIGANVGTTIKSAFQTIKWEDAGAALVQCIHAIIQYINGIISVQEFWSTLGTSIRDGIGGAIGAIVPEDWSNMIVNMVNGIATFLKNAFGDKERFVELGQKLAEVINGVFEGISGEDVAEGINAVLGAITTTINELLKDVDWSTVMSTLGETLKNLDWKSVFEIVALFAIPQIPGIVLPHLGSALGTVFAGIGSIILAHPWSLIVAGVIAGIAIAITHCDEIKEAVQGIIDWIGEKIQGIVDWVVEKFKAVSEYIKGVFDGSNMTKKMNNPGGYIGGVTFSAIPRFACGGIVGDGQLFIANEGGQPELIGTQGSQTVVMNNSQIVDSVSRGVRDAVTDVMMTFADNGNGNDGGDVVIYVDSEELARASLRGQKKLDKRSNPTVSFA